MSAISSIKRAAAFADGNLTQDAVVLKLMEPGRCHCSHCWPSTWAAINDYLGTNGPIEDEGDLAIDTDAGRIVLECHESGPEIVAFIDVGTAVVSLAAAITSLAIVIISAHRTHADSRSKSLRLRITRSTRGQIGEDSSIEMELPVSGEVSDLIMQHVVSTIERHT